MANKYLKFFDKNGNPLNFNYVGADATIPLTFNSNYESASTTVSPSAGKVSLYDIASKVLYMNIQDMNSYDITAWANSINQNISQGGNISLKITFYPSNVLTGSISSIVVSSSIVTITFSRLIGPVNISDGNSAYIETVTENLPGGYFEGSIYFDPVSTGLYENQQIFILQEFIDSVTGDSFIGYPHSGVTGSSSSVFWRTRWENDSYGNFDVSNVIFTYKITENDTELGGEPSITNYQNISTEVIQNTSDSFVNGLISTPEDQTPSRAFSINVALNSNSDGAEIYERRLILEDISYETPRKIMEILFYGQIIGEDTRLDVLTNNLGRAFFGEDSVILRDHDSSEPLPDYIEINEKRKELLVAGDDIFPYIGSYKGLIGALNFFGYQDLRIKEYWLNLNYDRISLAPAEENKIFLNHYKENRTINQSVLINDVLDNANSGKYRLEQTYGQNADGEYVLDISSEFTLIPSKTYKKTSLFGLYYDINTESTLLDPYGYPITNEAFLFSQEEVLLKLFALKERLKKTYLPLNARIIDITGEGVYFNVYNTKSWNDTLKRSDIDSGNFVDFKSNPDFGFIEDLRAFGLRKDPNSIQTPMNYYDSEDITVSVIGPSGDTFRFSGVTGDNPVLNLVKGKKYSFYLATSGYDLYLTTNSGLTGSSPLGVSNNGGESGTIISIDVNPQEESTIYYYSSVNTSKLNGSALILDANVSDLGNSIEPLKKSQYYSSSENSTMLDAISEFYYLKENGLLKNLGEGIHDGVSFIDPVTGDPYKNPIGMPLVLELILDSWTWDDMSMDWDSLELPENGSDKKALTWETVDFTTYNEIEWVIEKSSTQQGSGYSFSYRGYTKDFYKLAHFLPYTGVYDVTCFLYDSFNFKNRKIKKSAVTVSPKEITIDAWSRYKENENYTWDQTIRPWDDYDSIWEFPAEGKTFDELKTEIPEDILQFAIYGNNAIDGQELLVNKYTDSTGASGYFELTQNILDISAVYSNWISGSQYGFTTFRTSQEHSFTENSQIFVTGSIDDLNKSWRISIPDGATGYTFQVPYILYPQFAVGPTSGVASVAGGTGYYVMTDLLPEQKVTGGGSISVFIDGVLAGATTSGSNLQATVNSIIEEINLITTYPDYFAQSTSPDSSPAPINIVSNPEIGGIGNGAKLTVELTGSLELYSYDSVLSGGITGGTGYVQWDPTDPDTLLDNLVYFGTKNMNWNMLSESTWDEAYAHTWEDFEYNNGWLGGFELHNAKVGDNIKLNPGKDKYPFPIGATFYAPSGITGPSAYITLGDAAEQLNSADDPNITNFYYRVIPSNASALLTTSEPINTTFNIFATTIGTGAIPATVPGAPPALVVDFTYTQGT